MPEPWKPAPYSGPTAQDLTRAAPPNPGGVGPPRDMQYWLGLKYANIGKQTEGEYQKNISEASTLPGLREAQSGAYNAAAQLDTERAATETDRNISPDDARREYRLRQLGILPGGQGAAAPGTEAPPPLSGTPPPTQWTPQPWRTPVAPVAPQSVAPSSVAPLSIIPSIVTPRNDRRSSLTPSPLTQLSQTSLPTLLRPTTALASNSLLNLDTSTATLRKGTADVKAPKGAGLKKGSANVKSQNSKSNKSKGSAPPAGLEALLPMLMAAHAGGAGAPPAMGGAPMPIPPNGAAPPGFARGVSSVHGYGYADGSEDVSTLPPGYPGRGGAYVPPGYKPPAGYTPPTGPERYTPPPSYVLPGYTPPAAPDLTSPPNQPGRGGAYVPPGYTPRHGFAVGTPSVEPMPGYPFGAGYLFGATSVPGEGSGTVDKVPAMLAPHEAVLNRAAADMLGRGLIAALNHHGAAQMGMRRGAP